MVEDLNLASFSAIRGSDEFTLGKSTKEAWVRC